MDEHLQIGVFLACILASSSSKLANIFQTLMCCGPRSRFFFGINPAIYFCFQSLWTEFIFDLSDFFPETLSLSDTALQFFGPPGMKLTRTAQGSFDAVRLAAARTSVGLFLGMTMQLGLALFLS